MKLKHIGFVLWIVVLLYGGYYVYRHVIENHDRMNEPAAELPKGFDGRQFAEDLPWKRLPHISQSFELTERSGEQFDSHSLKGQPYVVSFFFSSCPTVCQELNEQIARLANRYQETDLRFISMSTDAKTDTPEVLRAYADGFESKSEKWFLLTGKQHVITQFANNQLMAVVNSGQHHTSDMFLIDRWGRYRDRFSFDDAREMKRFAEVLNEVLAETEPPLNKSITTRNMYASLSHALRSKAGTLPWLLDFELTDMHNEPFHSRDLTGTVWVGSFFFTRCGTVCPKQNAFLSKLQPEVFGRNAKLVSITTDPNYDKPEILRPYARELNAADTKTDSDWIFLTGDNDVYIKRIGSEFFGQSSHGEHHSSMLSVVDRWGDLRGHFDWQKEQEVTAMLDLIDELNKESRPTGNLP